MATGKRNKRGEITVKFNGDDLGTLCICALRYCMGRQTYMPDLVRGIVRGLLQTLDDKDIGVLYDDCLFQERTHQWGDETIDKPGWVKWRQEIEAEKGRRADNG